MTESQQNASAADAADLPFHVVVQHKSQVVEPAADESLDGGIFDADVSMDEIEEAYLKALQAAELTEIDMQAEFERPVSDVEMIETVSEELTVREADSVAPPVESFESQNALELTTEEDEDEPQIRAEQVVESLLFVGGAALPVKKFLDILGGAYTSEQVEEMLEALNQRYLAQRRPYDVRLTEGGYRLQLREEFEPVRSRAYGHGPKEVKLGQDALEVLAFIAYQQPVTREDLQETAKESLPALLRQLLRRELVCVDRSAPESGEQYRTTRRFLELFGLNSLEDLPQAGTFQFK